MNHFCRQASRLTSDALEHPLRLDQRIKLRIHFWMCSSCRNYADNLCTLRVTLWHMRNHKDENTHLADSRKQQIIDYCQKHNHSDSP